MLDLLHWMLENVHMLLRSMSNSGFRPQATVHRYTKRMADDGERLDGSSLEDFSSLEYLDTAGYRDMAGYLVYRWLALSYACEGRAEVLLPASTIRCADRAVSPSS